MKRTQPTDPQIVRRVTAMLEIVANSLSGQSAITVSDPPALLRRCIATLGTLQIMQQGAPSVASDAGVASYINDRVRHARDRRLE